MAYPQLPYDFERQTHSPCLPLARTMSQSASNNPSSEQAWTTRAYNLSTVEGARSLYDEWAETYDKTIFDPAHNYVAPALSAAALLDVFNSDNQRDQGETLEILDAGCGTGIVGVDFHKKAEAQNPNINMKIDGIDLSTGMLDIARKTGVYRSLETADLSQLPTSIPDHRYDAVICVGVLTTGHVGPGALAEFVRVVKSGGYIVATVKEDFWEGMGFEKEITGLEKAGKLQVISAKLEDSLRGKGIKMYLPILKVL